MKRWSILLLSLLPLWANALEVGERLAPWTLLDQFDEAYSLDSQARVLLVARSMEAAKLVNAALRINPGLSAGAPRCFRRGYPAHAGIDCQDVRGSGHA